MKSISMTLRLMTWVPGEQLELSELTFVSPRAKTFVLLQESHMINSW